MRRNRSTFIFLSACCIFVSLLTSAIYAWTDNSQHKTNEFTTSSLMYNVTLVEDFKSPQNWKEDETIVKKIFVRNGDKSDDVSNYDYQPMFVRIQIREFLGYEQRETIITESRYYQNNQNNFYKFEDEQEAIDFAVSLNLFEHSERVEELKGINDEKSMFYIRVLDDDANDISFNHLVMLKSTSDLVSLETGNLVTKIESSDDKHNNIGQSGQNLEDTILYKTHTWESGRPSFTPEYDIFSTYVTLNLGDDVISFEEWETNYQSQPIAKWIVDTNPFGEGWVYWGQPLIHSVITNTNSVTSNFMESITMKKRMEGVMEYRMHVNLDAVSSEDVDLWVNAPQSVKEALKNYSLN